MTNETQPRKAKARQKRRATLEHRPIIQHGTDLHFGAATAQPPLQSDRRHVTPVTHGEPYATLHRAGMADLVPTTLLLPRELDYMLRHVLAWVSPEGVTRTVTLSLDHGSFTVDQNCDGYQPEEGVEFHVGAPSDGDCIRQVLDEAADEVLVAMGRPPARTGSALCAPDNNSPNPKEVL